MSDDCTCNLEPSFVACDSYRSDENGWAVYDCEQEEVCITPSRRYALLVCAALEQMSDNHALAACVEHDKRNKAQPVPPGVES